MVYFLPKIVYICTVFKTVNILDRKIVKIKL